MCGLFLEFRMHILLVIISYLVCIGENRTFAETDFIQNLQQHTLVTTAGFDSGNTIRRQNFNFGHQLGYMYSKFDSAYFNPPGSFSFLTGFIAYHTPEMPLVKNPEWKKRTILMIPLGIEYTPCRVMSVQFDLTDLFIEFPFKNHENMGGKSPRVRTKILLLNERRIAPAIALTLGVKWSSAKPYTIWHDRHNYDESNGLAGAGTGVADYIILFTMSKNVLPELTLHCRFGLIPVGSPVLAGGYSGFGRQADEIPYGLSVEYKKRERLNVKAEIAGMYNGLPSTRLAHYSVARLLFNLNCFKSTISINLEKGLTSCTDQWVAGSYWGMVYKKRAAVSTR